MTGENALTVGAENIGTTVWDEKTDTHERTDAGEALLSADTLSLVDDESTLTLNLPDLGDLGDAFVLDIWLTGKKITPEDASGITLSGGDDTLRYFLQEVDGGHLIVRGSTKEVWVASVQGVVQGGITSFAWNDVGWKKVVMDTNMEINVEATEFENELTLRHLTGSNNKATLSVTNRGSVELTLNLDNALDGINNGDTTYQGSI